MKYVGELRPIKFILNQEPTTIFTTHASSIVLNHINEANITPYLVDQEPISAKIDKYEYDQLNVITDADH